MRDKKLIIWDFNGTIIDDVRVALASVNDMLIKRNLPQIDLDKYYSYVDTPIIKFYEHIFDDLYSMDFEEIAKEFDSGYEKYLPANPLMPGIKETLEHLARAGKVQTVVSASNAVKISNRLKYHGLYDYFDAVLARDDYTAADKNYLALNYFEKNNVNPKDAVVVGDCVADWQMAQTLGCECVLTTKGHQSRREFAVTDAVIIDDLEELSEIIK